MKPEHHIQSEIRQSRREMKNLSDERVLLRVQLRNLAAHWDSLIARKAKRNGTLKTAEEYGLEVETVRNLYRKFYSRKAA